MPKRDQNFKLNAYGILLEMYLEEIADRIIEVDVECQTDAFLDRPPTPLFIPAKTGKDVATQILEGEVQYFIWTSLYLLYKQVKLGLVKSLQTTS